VQKEATNLVKAFLASRQDKQVNHELH